MLRLHSKLISMRCVVFCLFGLFYSLADAATYEVDAVCATIPREKSLQAICSDPLLISARQLERSYWSALASVDTPQSYKKLRGELQQWRISSALCSSRNEPASTDCITRTISEFGTELESDFPESMEDTVESDELLESAQHALAALNRQMAIHLDTCRINAVETLDNDHASVNKVTRAISAACYAPAFDYVELMQAQQDGSALYLLKNSQLTPSTIKAETEKLYGMEANKSLVQETRAHRRQAK